MDCGQKSSGIHGKRTFGSSSGGFFHLPTGAKPTRGIPRVLHLFFSSFFKVWDIINSSLIANIPDPLTMEFLSYFLSFSASNLPRFLHSSSPSSSGIRFIRRGGSITVIPLLESVLVMTSGPSPLHPYDPKAIPILFLRGTLARLSTYFITDGIPAPL